MNVYKDWQLKRQSFRTESDMAAFAKRHGYNEKNSWKSIILLE